MKKTITTQDNTRIVITEFKVTGAKANIVVGGATGVPQRFYKHFASTANMNGFNVYTLDYRGIGESAPKSLKGFKVDYLDWAKQDLAALIDHASQERLALFLVGHSYGGQALGLLPNIDKIQAAYVFGTGAGYSGWMPALEKIKVDLLWKIIAPMVVSLKGYLAWHRFGMGENLPYGVYKQWKHWCQFPHYFFDDPSMEGITALYERYNKTLVAANAIDDKWATSLSRDAFMPFYKHAKLTSIDLQPSDYGLARVEHMGYFFKHASAIWTPIFDCFTLELDLLKNNSKHNIDDVAQR